MHVDVYTEMHIEMIAFRAGVRWRTYRHVCSVGKGCVGRHIDMFAMSGGGALEDSLLEFVEDLVDVISDCDAIAPPACGFVAALAFILC